MHDILAYASQVQVLGPEQEPWAPQLTVLQTGVEQVAPLQPETLHANNAEYFSARGKHNVRNPRLVQTMGNSMQGQGRLGGKRTGPASDSAGAEHDFTQN